MEQGGCRSVIAYSAWCSCRSTEFNLTMRPEVLTVSSRYTDLLRLGDRCVCTYPPVWHARLLATYGNANMYRPVINIKKRGGNGE